jgi:RHS repeat-associated protein
VLQLQPFGSIDGLSNADPKLVRFGSRDYDPGMGRWTNKDPIGFAGGDTNVYPYVGNDPVNLTDPSGLDTFMCTKPLHALGGEGTKSGPDSKENPLYHQFLCVKADEGTTTCGGQDHVPAGFWAIVTTGVQGTPSKDHWPTAGQGECNLVDARGCVDECVARRVSAKDRPWYAIGRMDTDCQEWSIAILEQCQQLCEGA